MSRSISPPATKRRKTAHPSPKPTSSPPSPPAPPPPSTLRIFSWNINGITPFLPSQPPITRFFPPRRPESPQPPSLRAFLHRHSYPSILLLQEVKISATDTRTQSQVRASVNQKLDAEDPLAPSYEAHFVLPTDRHNARGPRGSGKVYGVCCIYRSDLRARYNLTCLLRSVPWDREGRVAIMHLASPKESEERDFNLAVVNIYAVNGTTNPYRDPKTGEVRGTRHDRKLEVQRCLMEECVALERDGWCVVVGGDMNVALEGIDGYPNLRTYPRQHVVNRADFRARFGLGGSGADGQAEDAGEDGGCVWRAVDVWRERNRGRKGFTYYPTGRPWGTSCDRVDYFLVGRGMWEDGMVGAVGILESDFERGPSDHVPIWVDIRCERSG